MSIFKKVQYSDDNGKTPSDYICEILNGGTNIIKLATFISQIPNEGTLEGSPLCKIKTPSIGIWALTQKKYHLYYSYFKYRNEVCFLYLLNSKGIKDGHSEALNRVKQFYNL